MARSGGTDFHEKSVTKMYGSMLLALRGDGCLSNFQKKALRILEWPLIL